MDPISHGEWFISMREIWENSPREPSNRQAADSYLLLIIKGVSIACSTEGQLPSGAAGFVPVSREANIPRMKDSDTSVFLNRNSPRSL